MKEIFRNDTPISYEIVQSNIKKMNLPSVGKGSIREVKKLIDLIEKESGKKFVRMEMGIPGLTPSSIGTDAEIKALENGVAAIYPDIDGNPELKKQMSLFVKNFVNVNVSPESCIPTVGSMQGSFAAFLTLARMDAKRDTTLFIDPGFPVHKQQHKVLGQKFESFDVYDYRGEKLRDKLESYLKTGKIHSIFYSNPNNPSWVCLNDAELKIIGDLANQYDVVICEDLAYFGMDFRKDYSIPGQPPYQPSVASYTNNYILFVSSSKVFSYAGQRIGMMVISDKLFARKAPDLLKYYSSDIFGRAMVFGTVYALSSGTAHSAQYALSAMLKACNEGTHNFFKDVHVYAEKAHVMKKLFIDNGFHIVYDKDLDQPVADGFYFTIAYPGFSGDELIEELMYYGVSAISLSITGSTRLEGLRACVSLVHPSQFPDLEMRLKKFHEHHAEVKQACLSH